MSGTRPTGGNPAALALITGALLVVVTGAVIQRQADRDPDPAPSAPGATATAVTSAPMAPGVAYPECAVVPDPLRACVTVGTGEAYLVFPDGGAIPAIVDRIEVRGGERWVIVR